MKTFLDKHGIPYDGFTCDKIPAVAYFDDKAWRVPTGPFGLAWAVNEFLETV